MSSIPTPDKDDAGDADHARIEAAARALGEGKLVAFPTETVYGLGADAESKAALARLYAAKGRPVAHPVIVHLPSLAELPRYARKIPGGARALAERFWPGPLTLILPRRAGVLDEVTGGQDSVGLRVPAHPTARQLLTAFGRGVAAPSANRFGRISPTRAEHVREELGDLVDVILDGGPCAVGVESTILAFGDDDGAPPMLLRPGAVLPSQIAEVIGAAPLAATEKAPRAAGTLASHYAPRTPLEVVATVELQARARALVDGGQRVAVMALRSSARGADDLNPASIRRAPAEAEAYAASLYASLRALDAEGHDVILVEELPDDEAWSAAADRLRRAAHRET